MKLLLYLLALLLSHIVTAQTTFFEQNFDAGAPVSQYVSASPNKGQFNGISGPNGASIVNGTLQFDRSSGTGTGHFSRTTDISPSATSLYIQMDFEVVSATTVAGNNVMTFYVGSGFTSDVQNPANGDTYARFGFSFTSQGYEFAVRHVPAGGSGAINSATFTGKQTLTFLLNNTGYTIHYLRPTGGFDALPNDTYDLWVGGTKVFVNLPVLTPTQTLTDFKFRLTNNVYAANCQFDNILIRDISGALPVHLTRFTGEAQGPHILLNWQTATTDKAGEFTIEHRTETSEFVELGTLQSASTFTDEHPASGANYYRLRHTDPDGITSWSKVIQVRYEPNQPALLLLNNPTSADQIRVRTYALNQPTYRLTTLTGQPLPCQQRETPDGELTLLPQHPLPSGVYLLTATDGANRLTRRVLVQ